MVNDVARPAGTQATTPSAALDVSGQRAPMPVELLAAHGLESPGPVTRHVGTAAEQTAAQQRTDTALTAVADRIRSMDPQLRRLNESRRPTRQVEAANAASSEASKALDAVGHLRSAMQAHARTLGYDIDAAGMGLTDLQAALRAAREGADSLAAHASKTQYESWSNVSVTRADAVGTAMDRVQVVAEALTTADHQMLVALESARAGAATVVDATTQATGSVGIRQARLMAAAAAVAGVVGGLGTGIAIF